MSSRPGQLISPLHLLLLYRPLTPCVDGKQKISFFLLIQASLIVVGGGGGAWLCMEVECECGEGNEGIRNFILKESLSSTW